MRRLRVGLVVTTVFAAFACGEAPGMMADAMIDAGEALVDAGEDLIDAGEVDAQTPPMTFEVACDEESLILRTTTTATGQVTSEYMRYYAELTNAAVTADSDLHVTMCDRTVFGTPRENCAAGTTCERAQLEPLACTSAFLDAAIHTESGRARVLCGSRTMTLGPDGTSMVYVGERWDRVRFTLR
jgi:hypothetical protein